MKNKLQRDRNYNILSRIPVCLLFNILGALLHSGMDLIIPRTMHLPLYPLDLVISTMESPVVHL